MTASTLSMMNRGTTIGEFETEKWSIIIKEVDNYIQIMVGGKRDHRDRVMWYQQSRRLFPEHNHYRDEDDE